MPKSQFQDILSAMRQCAICGKSSKMVGHRIKLRGKYNPTNWSRKYANLQWGRVDGKRVKMCVQCLKTQHKTVKPKTKKA